MTFKRVWICALMVLLGISWGTAEAGWWVRYRGYPYRVYYLAPAPVYVQPYPVYVQPVPGFVQPTAVYVRPAPVYVQPPSVTPQSYLAVPQRLAVTVPVP